ncbi:AAA family ATPase [Profundibacter amoris]|uniref:Conjugal transfer protein TraA n=1 Tax=Profundibacter amoris TaxID=2171755 RepID=A0A347UG30_9RHOB|nr:AAA family ATPase [Profundibacter amoris]AXX97808.1 conjugal transfer protein TraA [Profundibacter amoris]
MILKASQRGGGMQLAVHLLKPENEHVELLEISGFVADDLAGAFKEVYAISKGTRCKQFLFSLSLNPPEMENAPVEVFEDVIARIEAKMGLAGQPRAIVFHEKQGRRHAHCVWSRIDAAKMKAINLPHFKLKLTELSRQIYLEQGWDMPRGLEDFAERDPLNYSQAEAQQAKRVKRDARALKEMFQKCWVGSDSRAAFTHALKEQGFILARGSRRGFVAVDAAGEVYAIARWVGVKIKEVRARLGDLEDLPNVEEAIAVLSRSFDVENFEAQQQAALQAERRKEILEQKRGSLVAVQRDEREVLRDMQQTRLAVEVAARMASLPTGLKASWAKMTGAYQRLCAENEALINEALRRDRRGQHDIIQRHLKARRALQHEFEQLEYHRELNAKSAQREIGTRLPDVEFTPEPVPLRPEYDLAQPLIIQPDENTLSIAEKVARDPAHILEVIADKKEAFTRADILRALVQYIPDPTNLRIAADAVLRSPDLVEVKAGSEPRYSTQEFVSIKATLSANARIMASSSAPYVARNHIDTAIFKENVVLQKSVGASLSAEQETAIRHVLTSGQLSCVIGLAGAGKSTMLSAARYAWEKQGFEVIGAALSGKAADGLETASGIESRTLASLEYSWKNGYNLLTRNSVLVIDEAGMVGTKQLARFVSAVKKSGATLILIGDPEQLQPIQAGRPFKDIAQENGAARLSEIRRQRQEWQRHASRNLAEGRCADAIGTYWQQGFVSTAVDTPEAIAKLAQDYVTDMELNGVGVSRLALTHRRKDVHAINQAIRSLRKSGGDLAVETLFQTDHGPRAFAAGDRIVFTRNDRDLGVKNGSFGMVEEIDNGQLRVRMDTDGSDKARSVTIMPDNYAAFDHGYACTIHKSQGATVDNAYVLDSNTMDHHLSYVAMTRHRDEMRLYGDPAALRRLEHNHDWSTIRVGDIRKHSGPDR